MKVALFLVVAALTACAKAEPPAPTDTLAPASAAPTAAAPSVAAASPSAQPSAAASANPNATDLPVEEDFEDEASQEVTAKSLDSQLDALEKEILAD